MDMDAKKQPKQWREAEEFNCDYPAAIKVEQVLIEELLPAVKKETEVEETHDLQNQGDEIVIKEEFPDVLNNMVENDEFVEEKRKTTSTDRSNPGDVYPIQNKFWSSSSSSLLHCSQSGAGEIQPSDTGTLPKMFSETNKLKEHSMADHSGNPIGHNMCSKAVRKGNSLNRFKLIVMRDSNGKIFICDVCSKVFQTKSSVKWHSMIHNPERPFPCDVCTKAYLRYCDLQKHLVMHTEQKLFKCNVCSKGFHRNDLLKKHVIIHTGVKPFPCNECSKAFRTRADLQYHSIIHSEKRDFLCVTCSKRFRRIHDLKRHVMVHENRKPFVCNFCSKPFRTRNECKQHIMVHNDEKPFICNVCSRAFRKAYHLKRHMNVHCGDTVKSVIDHVNESKVFVCIQ